MSGKSDLTESELEIAENYDVSKVQPSPYANQDDVIQEDYENDVDEEDES